MYERVIENDCFFVNREVENLSFFLCLFHSMQQKLVLEIQETKCPLRVHETFKGHKIIAYITNKKLHLKLNFYYIFNAFNFVGVHAIIFFKFKRT